MRVGGGDTFAVQRGRAVPGFIDRRGQRQAAATEVQTTQGKIAWIFTLSTAGQELFFQHVFTDDAEVNNAIHHKAGNIVITHAQNVDGHIFSQGNQALGVQVDFNPAAGEQFA